MMNVMQRFFHLKPTVILQISYRLFIEFTEAELFTNIIRTKPRDSEESSSREIQSFVDDFSSVSLIGLFHLLVN